MEYFVISGTIEKLRLTLCGVFGGGEFLVEFWWVYPIKHSRFWGRLGVSRHLCNLAVVCCTVEHVSHAGVRDVTTTQCYGHRTGL